MSKYAKPADGNSIVIKRDEKDDSVWWVIDLSAEDNVVQMIKCNDLVEARKKAEEIAGFKFVLGDLDDDY